MLFPGVRISAAACRGEAPARLPAQVPGGDPDVRVAGAGAGPGHHRAVPAGQLAVPGLGCHRGQPAAAR